VRLGINFGSIPETRAIGCASVKAGLLGGLVVTVFVASALFWENGASLSAREVLIAPAAFLYIFMMGSLIGGLATNMSLWLFGLIIARASRGVLHRPTGWFLAVGSAVFITTFLSLPFAWDPETLILMNLLVNAYAIPAAIFYRQSILFDQ